MQFIYYGSTQVNREAATKMEWEKSVASRTYPKFSSKVISLAVHVTVSSFCAQLEI